jgi:hypothetical protein
VNETTGRPTGSELLPAALVLALITALFGWWGWREGAYFGQVFYPGAIGVFALFAVLLIGAPLRLRPRGPALIAFGCLAALALWIALSLLWTSTQDNAVLYAEHALLYLALFGIGFWACGLLGGRRMLALVPVALAATGVGIAVVVVLAGGTDLHTYFHADATLRFPIGYRNANAAFFLIGLWPLLALATEGRAPAWSRGLAVGAATMLLELAILAQSRGSIPAAAIGLLAFLAFSPRRVRAALFVALAAAPVLLALPTLLDVYQHGELNQAMVPLLRDAARVIVITALASTVLAGVYTGLVEPRLRLSAKTARRGSWALGILATVALVVLAAGFFAQRGGPIHFLDQRLNQFQQSSSPELRDQSARFGTNVESHRSDFWRVAWHAGLDEPLIGGGAGSFELAYLQERDGYETPKDPHNVELLMFSELGVPGLALFAGFFAAALIGAALSRRAGTTAAAVGAGAAGAAAYWLLHGSYDWLWNYPAITAPVVFLLGAALAAGAREESVGARIRLPVLAACALCALAAVPLFLSDRYAQRGLAEFESNPAAAVGDLDRAASLNPFAVEPLIYKGIDDAQLGDRAAALAAFTHARERQPDNYAPYYFTAELLARTQPRRAAAQLARAAALNPRDPQVRALARSLRPLRKRAATVAQARD